jgi:single-strand DNA-binding protein
MNDIHVTLRGNIATEPRQMRFDDGNALTSFRLASNSRRFDRERQVWVDRATYVNVTCRRAMALNAGASLHKGQPVVVTGRLWERFWSSNGRSGTTLEVIAETLGHDLSFGTTEFARVIRTQRVGHASDRSEDEIAAMVDTDAENEGLVRRPTDVTGLTVLEDTDDDEAAYQPEPAPDVAGLMAELPDPVNA